ncbi:MAG: hypothetical protein LBQ50_02470, partial [Planctomycetaceae bacterium]|nr:hypothetical protein [Planctomycetaceae bacterium]
IPALKGRDNPAHRNAVGLGISINNDALKGQYKIKKNLFPILPFQGDGYWKIVTHRVAVGWLMLPLAGRIPEYLQKSCPTKSETIRKITQLVGLYF